MKLDPIEGAYKAPKQRQKQRHSQQIVCPNCSNTVTAQDINIGDKIAKCGSCSQIFSFQNVINNLVQGPASKKKPVVANQNDVDIYEYAGELSITILDLNDLWAMITFTISIIPLLFFTVAGTAKGANIQLPVSIFLPIFLYSIYRLVKYRENKAYIDVDDICLTVTPSQKYLQRKKKYLISDIKQIYTRLHPGSKSWTYLYMIHQGPSGEEHVKLGPIYASRSSALYVEQELEAFIGIPDESVPEETKFD